MSLPFPPTPESSRQPSRLEQDQRLSRAEQPAVGTVSVIGAGVMGRGIAAANVASGISVTLSDTAEAALSAAVAEIQLASRPAENAVASIRSSQNREDLAAADLIIEAVIERLAVKQRIFQKLEPLARPETIFASNTSSIPVTQIAAKLTHPERFVGLHFCHPVAERPLLEIVRADQTSNETIAAAVNYAYQIGKRPVVVKDGPGFVVNRLLTPYLNEALQLLLEGATVEQIEAAAVAFGMPVGPLTAIDAIGIDVALRAGTTIYEAFPERMLPSALLLALFERGHFGRKTGRGFFVYHDQGLQDCVSPTALTLIAEKRQEERSFSQKELTARLMLPMLTEAARTLEEGFVDRPQDIDDAVVYGLGFPAAHGGILAWADRLGMRKVLRMLDPFKELGPRYQPLPQLRAMAVTGHRFYADVLRRAG